MIVDIAFTVPNNARAAGQVHNHTNSGFTAPSAGDIYALLDNHTDFNHGNTKLRYEGTIIAAFDNSKYAIAISDLAQAQMFSVTRYGYLNPFSSDWRTGSTISVAAQQSFNFFYQRDSTLTEAIRIDRAYELSQAAVLNSFKTGIILFKRDSLGYFKPIIVDIRKDPADSSKNIYVQKCL